MHEHVQLLTCCAPFSGCSSAWWYYISWTQQLLCKLNGLMTGQRVHLLHTFADLTARFDNHLERVYIFGYNSCRRRLHLCNKQKPFLLHQKQHLSHVQVIAQEQRKRCLKHVICSIVLLQASGTAAVRHKAWLCDPKIIAYLANFLQHRPGPQLGFRSRTVASGQTSEQADPVTSLSFQCKLQG